VEVAAVASVVDRADVRRAVLHDGVLTEPGGEWSATAALQPQPEQVTAALRFRVIDEARARVQRRIVRQPLHVAWTEVHLDRDARLVRDLVE
jgi:hypothetical protein